MRLLDLFRAPPPYAAELRGLTLRDAERWLRDNIGYSRKGAKHFLSQHKRRLDLVQ